MKDRLAYKIPLKFGRVQHQHLISWDSVAVFPRVIYGGKSKSIGTFHNQHIYRKYTETMQVLLFHVNPLDFKSPIPAFHKFFFFNSVRKEVFWLRL